MQRKIRFRTIKTEIRILGVDDGSFTPRTSRKVDVVGTVFCGGCWLDGVLRTRIEVDGIDSTEKIAAMVMDSPHYDQLRVIMLNGVTFAGFNVVDIRNLFEITGLPIIVVMRKKPNLESIKEALRNLPNWRERWRSILRAGEITKLKTQRETEPIYIQIAGISGDDAKRIVKISSTRSSIPEALRVAHLIASGLAKLEPCSLETKRLKFQEK